MRQIGDLPIFEPARPRVTLRADEVGVRSELPENWTSPRARASPPVFAIATAPASNRLGQCGKPGYQSSFESTTGTLETFVTLAAIQLAIRRLARM
jgi:hypothetical protein